jgi:hypothetical protein
MFRIIFIELKRLFSNKLSLALAVLAPVISLLFLASLIAPLFFSNQRLSRMEIAVFQEETHPDAQVVIENVIASDQIQSLVDVEFVDSISEGVAQTESGEAAIFIHIPAGLIDKLYEREQVTISIWISPEYYFEAAILMPIFNSVVDGFNRIQLALDTIYYRALEEFPQDFVWQHYYDLTVFLGVRVLNRPVLFDIEGISPLGRYLPIEYYTSAIFAFFTGLGLIPLCGYNAKDFTSAALSRGLAVTRWRYQYLLARVISGTLYILLVALPMLLVGILIVGMDISFGGSLLALFGVTIISALCFSTLSVLFALVLPKGDNAVWLGFYFILFMALLGGVIFPDDYLPRVLLTIGRFSPLRAGMNNFAISLFDYRFGKLQFSLFVQLTWFALAFFISLPLFNRRVRS